MFLSRQHRFLFVHVQKTGGQSLADLLRQHVPDLQPFLGTHDPASAAREALGPGWDGLFRFAFVRNPWDRLVSWYSMIRQQSQGRPRRQLNRLWNYVLEQGPTFEDFVRNCTATIDDVDGRKSFLFNQADYVCDSSGKLIVDFVGRYENLSSDSALVLRRLGLPGLKLPHVNRSRHEHYSRYYTEETRQIVAERYARDLELFGYRFETE